MSTSWNTLKRQAGVEDLQLKDLRTYFNHILKTKYIFTSKEAGSYIGNSEVVNDRHYTPISDSVILAKMQQIPLNNIIASPNSIYPN